jgi:hypothetical protein
MGTAGADTPTIASAQTVGITTFLAPLAAEDIAAVIEEVEGRAIRLIEVPTERDEAREEATWRLLTKQRTPGRSGSASRAMASSRRTSRRLPPIRVLGRSSWGRSQSY